MISLTTAKLLLFIALCLGPKDISHSILITSNSSNIVWTREAHGWNLVEKGLPTNDWPANGLDVSTADLNNFGPKNTPIVRVISHHDWKQEPVLFLSNGNRLEKLDNKVLYTVNPGAPNEKTYSILYVENGTPL